MKNNRPKSLPKNISDLKKELDLMHSQFDYSTDGKKVSNTEPIALKNITSKGDFAKYLKKHLDIAMKEYKKKLKLE
ncbi:MAG: hypothetical protein L3J23_02370 [Flavobacteriaceae bacterium]|nr:hypothetical protein [Flavobacteriaceae bacterium]